MIKSLPSGAPVLRLGLCNLAQPCLRLVQHAPRFQFHDATLLRVIDGRLDLNDGLNQIVLDAHPSVLLVDANTCSEATLRWRLAQENMRFEEILLDTRMYYGMLLLQTTSWNIPRIAEACGYQLRARFSERFRTRFGYLPSTVR